MLKSTHPCVACLCSVYSSYLPENLVSKRCEGCKNLLRRPPLPALKEKLQVLEKTRFELEPDEDGLVLLLFVDQLERDAQRELAQKEEFPPAICTKRSKNSVVAYRSRKQTARKSAKVKPLVMKKGSRPLRNVTPRNKVHYPTFMHTDVYA